VFYYAGFLWAVSAWLIADARRLGIDLPLDIGWFVYLACPLLLPYHVFKTRGVRGFIILAGFVGVFVATYLIGLVVFLFLVATRSG
jgi:hypothetical protein